MNHLMLDLETMGNKPDAPIVAIGAVMFDPMTEVPGATFCTAVSLRSSMEAGAVPDADTILWWLKQSPEARAAICQDDALHINDALKALSAFVAEHCDEPKYLKVWGNGASFDNVILRSAYDAAKITPPWYWSNDRDVRTIVDMGRILDFDPKRDMPFTGERHNALDDAIHQARYVSAIYQRLLAPHVES